MNTCSNGRCQGTVTTFAGDGTPGSIDGSASTARFNSPMGIAFSGGWFYITDMHSIKTIDKNGNVDTIAVIAKL